MVWNLILNILFASLQFEFNSQNRPRIQRRSPLLCHDQSRLLVRNEHAGIVCHHMMSTGMWFSIFSPFSCPSSSRQLRLREQHQLPKKRLSLHPIRRRGLGRNQLPVSIVRDMFDCCTLFDFLISIPHPALSLHWFPTNRIQIPHGR